MMIENREPYKLAVSEQTATGLGHPTKQKKCHLTALTDSLFLLWKTDGTLRLFDSKAKRTKKIVHHATIQMLILDNHKIFTTLSSTNDVVQHVINPHKKRKPKSTLCHLEQSDVHHCFSEKNIFLSKRDAWEVYEAIQTSGAYRHVFRVSPHVMSDTTNAICHLSNGLIATGNTIGQLVFWNNEGTLVQTQDLSHGSLSQQIRRIVELAPHHLAIEFSSRIHIVNPQDLTAKPLIHEGVSLVPAGKAYHDDRLIVERRGIPKDRGPFEIWNLKTGELVYLQDKKSYHSTFAQFVSPDCVIGAGEENSVKLWNAADGTQIAQLEQLDGNDVYEAAPDQFLCSAGSYQVGLFKPDSQSLTLFDIPLSSPISSYDYAPGGAVVICTQDGHLYSGIPEG